VQRIKDKKTPAKGYGNNEKRYASADFKRMAASYLGRWDLVQLRCSNFMSCTLEERVALILLELSENFGVRDGQGLRLTVPARHKDLAELVGATRARITEYLTTFERRHLIVRDGRQLIVSRERLEDFLARPAAASTRLRRERSYSGLL
jgi:hypothetical protein